MSQSSYIVPEQGDGHARWARVKRALPADSTADMSEKIINALRLVATVTNNSVLQYKLSPGTSSSDPEVAEYLRNLITELTHSHFLLLLGFLRDEEKTYELALKRPKVMGDWQTIFSADFVQGNTQKLYELLDVFQSVRTRIPNVPDGVHAPEMLVNNVEEAWSRIGALPVNQDMTLLQFIQTLKNWSIRNGNQPIFICDECLPAVICKTKAGHECSIIDFIKYLQEQDPDFKNIFFLHPAFFRSESEELQQAAEENTAHNKDDFYVGENVKKIRKIVAPADAVVLMEYEQAIQQAATDISDYLPHAHNTLIFDDAATHPPFSINAESSLAPMLGMVGVYQATYATSANNALLRDAYTRYQKSIEDLSSNEIAAILAKTNDPNEQIELMRKKARDKMLQSIFRETFFTGATISVFLSTILGLFLGPYAPFALIPAWIGIVISGMAALWNKHLLEKKINKIDKMNKAMNSNEFDQLIVEKLHQYQSHKLHAESQLEKDVLNKVSLASALVIFGTRIATLASAATLLIAPIVFSIAAAIKLPIDWRKTNLHLRLMRRNPLAAMYAAREINIEPVSATAHTFMRNDFRKYLLEKDRAEQLRAMLIKEGIEIPKTTSPVERGLRFILSTVGLWDSEEDYNLIEALYDPNPKSIALLRKLRKECKEHVLTERLKKHLNDHGKELGLPETSLLELRNQCDAGNTEHYNILMKDYLEKTAVENVGKVVMNTGMSTTILASVIAVALGMTYSPIGLLALPAIFPLIAIGYGISKLAAHVEMQKMRTAINKKVTTEDIKDLLAHTRQLELPRDRGLYSGLSDQHRIHTELPEPTTAREAVKPTIRNTLLDTVKKLRPKRRHQ